MSIHHGIVKEVRSGDTLVLFGPATQVPPQEFSVTLSGIIAPRLGRKESTDEPYAWAAREFLRTKHIGKKVQFRIDSEYNGRAFGTVWNNGENVTLALVAAGLARVKDKGQGPEFEDLQGIQEEAMGAGRGIHSEDAMTLSDATRVVVDADFDVEEFHEMNKGRALHGIVERVRDAGCVGVYVLPEFQYMNLFLSGVSAPRAPRNPQTEEIEYQPFYHEAKFVVESLALQRNVLFYIDQVDKNGTPYATVLLEDGNIGEELLRRGLAKTVDWSCELSACKTGMRLAERAAREAMLGIWKDYVPPANANRKATGDTTWAARVVEVRSGDMLIVERAGKQEHMTVSLASVRCPRLGNQRNDVPDAPWAFEAKEQLRSQLIGQTVSVKVDYMRLVGEVERPFVTVTYKQKNVAVQLAKAGLCEVLRHRGDEDRSSAYDALEEAQEEAQQKKARLWGPEGAAPAHRFNDQSANGQKARNFLPHLQRGGKVRAIVDFVANAAQLRLTLPDNASSISFKLGGVRCPNTSRTVQGETTPGDEFGDEAQYYTKLHTLQRDVDIQIDATDRGGNFLGSLFVNGESLAVNLLRNGFAWCSETADRSQYAQQMESAQKEARDKKLRVWASYDPEAERRQAEEAAAAEAKATPKKVRVEPQVVINGNTFFTHMDKEEAKGLVQMRAKQFQFGDFAAPSPGGRYRKNQHCSAMYEGSMYRAKVVSFEAEWYEVFFIDYGNTSWVKETDMQPWEGDTSVPPLAFECKLAYVRAPALSDDFGKDAARFLHDSIVSKQLTAEIVGRQGEVLHVLLHDGKTFVNAEALKSGFTMLTKEAKRNPTPTKELNQLRASIEEAKRMHLNLWRYGDPESDDEEPRAWGR